MTICYVSSYFCSSLEPEVTFSASKFVIRLCGCCCWCDFCAFSCGNCYCCCDCCFASRSMGFILKSKLYMVMNFRTTFSAICLFLYWQKTCVLSDRGYILSWSCCLGLNYRIFLFRLMGLCVSLVYMVSKCILTAEVELTFWTLSVVVLSVFLFYVVLWSILIFEYLLTDIACKFVRISWLRPGYGMFKTVKVFLVFWSARDVNVAVLTVRTMC